jgi:hypothetical protein
MRAGRYPLEALARLRARKVEDAARELAAEIAAREEASRRRAAAHRQARAHDDAVRAARAEHGAALDRGELRVADLMRADAWDARVRAEHEALAERARDATTREIAAAESESSARRALAARDAEARVVERDRGRHEARARALGEAAEEDAADEAFLGRKEAR